VIDASSEVVAGASYDGPARYSSSVT